MYYASLALIFILHIKYLSCMIGEDAEEVTTAEPMSIRSLDYNDLCKFQASEYDCGKTGIKRYRYFYDIKLEACKTTSVGDCKDNANVFTDLETCKELCRDDGLHPVSKNLTPNVFCRFQPDFGLCFDYHPLWYFDVSSKVCRGFSYSGCGGNQNKFKTALDCASVCAPAVDYVKDDE